MSGMPMILRSLLGGSAITLAALAVLRDLRKHPRTEKTTSSFLNKTEETMMASEQRVLVGKMTHLGRLIIVIAVVSAGLLLTSAGIWVWTGLYGS